MKYISLVYFFRFKQETAPPTKSEWINKKQVYYVYFSVNIERKNYKQKKKDLLALMLEHTFSPYVLSGLIITSFCVHIIIV